MNSQYIFNNEAIAAVAIGHLARINKELPFAKAVLYLPFLLHEPTLRRLNSISNKRSIEEFIAQYPDALVNFNARFLDFLPLTLNSITILYEAGVISISQEHIVYNERSDFSPFKVGNRAERVIRACRAISLLLQEENVNSLYLKLKIQL